MKQEKKECEHLMPDPFTVDQMMKVIEQTHNWKSPGLDKLQHFCVKWFFVMPEGLTRALTDMKKDPKIFLQGYIRNYLLLSKGKEMKDPKNYCPVTCLPTVCCILTAAWTNRICNHLLRNSSPRTTERPSQNV